MSNKSANVVARVEPEVKEQAEAILDSLGVSASTVINMLYRQIVLTRSVPFSISLPARPLARDNMSEEEFNAMMQRAFDDVKAGRTYSLDETFADVDEAIGY